MFTNDKSSVFREIIIGKVVNGVMELSNTLWNVMELSKKTAQTTNKTTSIKDLGLKESGEHVLTVTRRKIAISSF